jgi:hypothetical protein
MPFEEKMSWASVIVTVVVAGSYFATMLGQLGTTPAAEIVYQPAMIAAIVASVVLMVLSAILVATGSAIKSAVIGDGSVTDIDRKDERDVAVRRRGDVVAYYVASVGAVCVLGLTMAQYPYFWIANALYLTFVIATLTGEIVKITAYRRGL